MMRGLFVTAVLAAASVAYAQPRPPGPPAAVFDSTGWDLLGTQEVAGKRDRDVIQVGRREGKFDKLMLVVTDSDIELKDLTVVFANGQRWSPGGLKHIFREGQRTRPIDLPGNDRIIQRIELVYGNVWGRGRAKVSVYGMDTRSRGGHGHGHAGPRAPAFNPAGWTLLGSQTVQGRRDRDSIRVGRYKGAFDQLTLVVSDNDIELRDMTIVFTNGQKWSPKVQHYFREGQRSRAIDLPGKDRTISRIDLVYSNLPGGGRAKVEVYGRDLGRPAPPPFKPVVWDNKGWTFLGKTTVDGWRDRDKLNVTNAKPYSEVMFVVTGSDVQLHNVVITLGNNEKYSMPSSVTFREGTRTAPVDLPGAARRIRSIEFAYSNLPGGGRAQIEVWARVKPHAPPPPPPAVTPPPPVTPPPAVRDHRR